jgi:predicted AAA+ superfamily ATPase
LTVPVPTTIAAYDAFILYLAHRYDIKGKRILKQEKKYYAVDLGMRRIQLNYAWVEECDW